MGVLGMLTGRTSAEKVLSIAEKATDGLVSGVDKLFYTDEEKADSAMKRAEIAKDLSEIHLRLMETTATENTARSITRRILAIMIMEVFLALLLASALLWKMDPEWSLHFLDVAKELSGLALGVGLFFFGGYVGTRVIGTFSKGKKP